MVRSYPEANAAVRAAPRQVVLEFSEPADPAFTTAEVIAADGRRRSGDVALSADGQRLTVNLEPLPDGVYTVRWRALWPRDGHATAGLLVFAVGQTAPPAFASTMDVLPPLIRVMIRWGAYLSALLLAGAVFFQAFMVYPGAASLRAVPILAALTLLFVTAELIQQIGTLLGGSLRGLFGSGLLGGFLTGTKSGWSILIRIAMAALLVIPPSPSGRILTLGGLTSVVIVGMLTAPFGGPGALAGSTHFMLVILAVSTYTVFTVIAAAVLPQVPDLRRRIPRWPWVSPVAAAIMLGGFTLNAHAAGEGIPAATADWLHLVASAAWIGGLAALLLVLVSAPRAERSDLAKVLVPRFSTLAGVSLAVLIATGVYSALNYVPSLGSIASTVYGRLLGIKLALVIPLAALGAVNRFILRPRLAIGAAPPTTVRRFLRIVTSEVSLGVLIVLVVAALTITPTARTVTSTQTASTPGLALAGVADAMRVTLTVGSAERAPGRVEVTIAGEDGRPITATTPDEIRVFVRLLKLDEEVEPIIVPLERSVAGSRYVGEDRTLTLPGFWQVEVVVRRGGRLDATTVFPLDTATQMPTPPGESALGWLGRMEAAMTGLRAWRERQQITDGKDGVVITRLDFMPPDRLRYRTEQAEAVIIGLTQYVRSGSLPWERRELPERFSVERYLGSYLDGAWGARLGRRGQCGEEPCRVVLWNPPGGTYSLAAWVGEKTHRLHTLFMAGPSHYMTTVVTAFNPDIRIEPPP